MAVVWPTSAELSEFMEMAGLDTSVVDVPACAAAGQAEFERLCGWRPFLGTTQTRKFDAPVDGWKLHLDGALLTVTSLTVDGQAYVADSDYYLMPDNAVNRGAAYTWVEFAFPVACARRGIVIVGSWGRVSDIPEAVRHAVLCLGAVAAMPSVLSAKGGGLAAWTEGDVTEKYSADGLKVTAGEWERAARACAARYRAPRIA